MYDLLHSFLSDKKGGEIFTLFGPWHFFYLLLTAAAAIAILCFLRKKDDSTKKRAPRLFINVSFGLYIADLFLMPLAYGEIDIEKLPFHACTAMCVACFLSYRFPLLEKYRPSLAMLGFISNLVYLIYPAGVMWHGVHPLSYRVIQTLLFHSIMTIYGFLVMICESDRFHVKLCYRDLAVTACMTLWALVGNYAYNGESEGYSHFFNWFFVVRDPFYALPEEISPFIMPFLNLALFFAAQMLVHLIIWGIKRIKKP